MRICVVVLVAMLTSFACSLAFKDVDPAPNEICEGMSRVYERGPESTAQGRFQHIDYRQGTLTFRVRALVPFYQNTPLVSLAGIDIIAFVDGIQLQIDGLGAISVKIPDALWELDREHFVALRWDTNHPLSGTTGGNQIELRVDGTVRYSGNPEPIELMPDPNAEPYLIFGAGQGRFHVDQAVIYDRPLFVNSDSNDQSELDRLVDRRYSPLVANGGFDVLLATVSPKDFDCEIEGWAFNEGEELLTGSLKLGPGTTDIDGVIPDPVDQVYPDGGAKIGTGGSKTIRLNLTTNGSYVLELLTHSIGEGEALPVVNVMIGDTTIHHQGTASSRENPLRSVLTFQTGPTNTPVDIELAALDGQVAFDSITLRPNLFDEAGFEGTESPVESPWRKELNPDTSVEYDAEPPYAGARSICIVSIDAPGAPDVVQQEPKVRATEASKMADHELYLVGAQFLWRGARLPSLNIGNGSLFATGSHYDRDRKAGAPAAKQDVWHSVSTVGRRLHDPKMSSNNEHNNHNDLIRFGTGYESGDSDFCLDSAYNIKLDRIGGDERPQDDP